MSFIDRILWQARQRPKAPALGLSDVSPEIVTYGQLEISVANLCRRLDALGVAPGKLYGLRVNNDLLHITLTLALENIGAATVAVAEPAQVAGWPIAGMFVTGRDGDWPFPVETVNASWLEGDGVYVPKSKHRNDRDELCHVAWTSGSTGKPKGVPLTRRLAAARVAQFQHRLGAEFGRQSRIFSSMGFSSGWAYLLLNHMLSRGGLLCLSAPTLERTMRNFSTYMIRAMVASPLYLSELMALSRQEGREFQSLQVIVSSGGALRSAIAETIRNRICGRLVSSYGSVEAGGVANASVELLDLERGETGFINPGVTVEIVDPSTREPVTDGAGCVRVRTEYVSSGYFGPHSPEEWRFEGGSFLSTDIATLSPNGLLSILGRDSNVVNLGGPKTTLEVVETHYARAPGVAEVASVVAAGPLGLDELVAFIVPSDQWSEEGFLQYCQSKLAPEFYPKRLIVVQSLPRVANGKVDRQKLPSLL